VVWHYLDVFIEMLREGKPFPFTALRDRKVAYDDGLLSEIDALVRRESLRPMLQAAVDEATGALRKARMDVAAGQTTASASVKLAAKAVAGAALLSRGDLPASGPELEDQLHANGDSQLAGLVRRTRSDPTAHDLPELLDGLETLLAKLETQTS
jgi:hypothetical protein